MEDMTCKKVLHIGPSKAKKGTELYGCNPRPAPGGVVSDPSLRDSESVCDFLGREKTLCGMRFGGLSSAMERIRLHENCS